MVTAPRGEGISIGANGRRYPEFGFPAYLSKKCGLILSLAGSLDRYGKHKPHPGENEDHGPSRLRGVWVGSCAADSLGAGHRQGALAPLAAMPRVRVELRRHPRRA